MRQGFFIDPLPPSAAVPLTEGDTNAGKISESYSPPCEAESRLRKREPDSAKHQEKAAGGQLRRLYVHAVRMRS